MPDNGSISEKLVISLCRITELNWSPWHGKPPDQTSNVTQSSRAFVLFLCDLYFYFMYKNVFIKWLALFLFCLQNNLIEYVTLLSSINTIATAGNFVLFWVLLRYIFHIEKRCNTAVQICCFIKTFNFSNCVILHELILVLCHDLVL